MGKVIYQHTNEKSFQGNPLLEALPPVMSTREAARKLIEQPDYSPDCRMASPEERLVMTQKVSRFYQPSLKDINLLADVDKCIRWGYSERNPLSADYRLRFGAGAVAREEGYSYARFIPTDGGVAVLGISGLGKTSSMRKILSLYPQIITHREYENTHFQETQVVWLHTDIPRDGSLKSLCSDFFYNIDRLCGTDFARQYAGNRTKANDMMEGLCKVALNVHLGIWVLDEFQNLCPSSRSNRVSIDTLNTIVNLVNRINVPIIMIGTPRALPIFRKELQQVKRASSQGHDYWERMEEDEEWEMFVRAMWRYQFTAIEVPLTDDLVHHIYEESVGIPFLATQLYKLVQEKAILSGSEKFDEKDIHKIANKKLGLAKPMVKALKSGKDYDLKAFLDLGPFTLEDYQYVFAENPAPPENHQAPDKQSIQSKAFKTLIGMGLSPKEVKHFLNLALANHPDCQSDSIIAREAYAEYLKKAECNEENTKENDHEIKTAEVAIGYEENLANGTIGL